MRTRLSICRKKARYASGTNAIAAAQGAPFALPELPGRPLAQILLNIGVVAADHPRQCGEIFSPLGA